MDKMQTKQRNKIKLDTNVAAKWVEEILKPKSLYELWVMNEKKFPFTAVKIVKTSCPTGTNLPVGTTRTLISVHAQFPHHFHNGDYAINYEPKAWRLAND